MASHYPHRMSDVPLAGPAERIVPVSPVFPLDARIDGDPYFAPAIHADLLAKVMRDDDMANAIRGEDPDEETHWIERALVEATCIIGFGTLAFAVVFYALGLIGRGA